MDSITLAAKKRKNLEDAAERIIASDIYCNQSLLVTQILDLAAQFENHSNDLPFTDDDIEGQYTDADNMNATQCIAWLRDRGYSVASDVLETYSEDSELLAVLREGLEGEFTLEELLALRDGGGEDYLPDNILDDLREEVRENDDGKEVNEWWLVSGYLAGKLKEQGEVILDAGYVGVWWGRGASGQGILLDGIIQRIVGTTESANAPLD